MLNVAQLGRRIQERRRAQGLTQEQLGTELGVSAQAVSKWEKGESAPDIGILPSLCQTLGISADNLLGISGGPGAEQLVHDLRGRLRQMRPEDRERALFTALESLLSTSELEHDSGQPPASSVICLFDQDRLAGLRLIQKNGFAALVLAEALAPSTPKPADQLDALRTLIAPGCLDVTLSLLAGPQREADLLRTSLDLSVDDVRAALTGLVEAGLVIQGKTGYRLEDGIGYAWVSIISAIASFTSPTMITHLEVNNRD